MEPGQPKPGAQAPPPEAACARRAQQLPEPGASTCPPVSLALLGLLPAPELLTLPCNLLLGLALLLSCRRQLLQLPLHQRPIMRVAEPQTLGEGSKGEVKSPRAPHLANPSPGFSVPQVYSRWSSLPALSLHLPGLLMDQNPQGKNLEWEWLGEMRVNGAGFQALCPFPTLILGSYPSSTQDFSLGITLPDSVRPEVGSEFVRGHTASQ